MNPNLNLAKPSIIPLMRHWKGWDAVNCPNQSAYTQSGFEKWVWVWANKPTFTPPVAGKYPALTILEPIYQSQHSTTIYYTYNEKLGWLRCCEMLESIQTYPILVWNVGYWWSQNCSHPQLKSRGVVMVVDDESKSQPCKTIHYTSNETLEGLRCCELPEPVSIHSIWVWKVGMGMGQQANFHPTRSWKIPCIDHFRAHLPISTFYNHSLFIMRNWDGWDAVKFLNQSKHTPSWYET